MKTKRPKRNQAAEARHKHRVAATNYSAEQTKVVQTVAIMSLGTVHGQQLYRAWIDRYTGYQYTMHDNILIILFLLMIL